MAIKRRKRGNRVYLEEWKSTRRNGKVVSTFVRYIGPEGGERRASPIDRMEHGDAVHSGAVRLLWSMAEDLHFAETIDRISGADHADAASPGKILTVWAINRLLDPMSATKLERWVPTTELPELAGIAADAFSKDAFLHALDRVCRYDAEAGAETESIRAIDDALYSDWRHSHPLSGRATLAYDLTDILFFGVTCPIAAKGANPDHQNRLQVNATVVADRGDGAPLFHFVYDGKRNGSTTLRNLLVELQHYDIEKGLLVVDRGMVNKANVEQCNGTGWHLLGGVSRHLKDAKAAIAGTEVPETPDTFAVGSRTGPVYAVSTHAKLFGSDRKIVVYSNAQRGMREREARNSALRRIGMALDALSSEGKEWKEARLHREMRKITAGWDEFIEARVKRNGSKRVEWRYRERELAREARMDGKYLLICTDGSMDARSVVNTYFSKDFVEKAFRTLKSSIEIEPVRHRLTHRVRGYVFVCMLAYRLEMALRRMLVEGGAEENAAQYMERLLSELSEVRKVEVKLGGQSRIWYLNVTDFINEGLRKLDRKDILKEHVGGNSML